MGCNVSKDVKVEEQRDGNDDGSLSEEKAAEKIQASFRGYKTRKSLKNNGVLPEQVMNKTENKPPETKPSSQTPVEITNQDESLADIDLTDEDLKKAASKIQASYRNFAAKKKEDPDAATEEETNETEKEESSANENKEEDENLDDIDLEDPDVAKAALKIQSTFRGYKARKEINEEGEAPLHNGHE